MSTINSSIKRLSGPESSGLGIVSLISLAHGTTHWVNATLYVLLPFIAIDLGLSYTEVGSLMTLFYVSTFLTNVASGPAVDLTGRHVVFMLASLLIGGSALLVLWGASSPVLIGVTLILIGISVSMWHPPSISYLSRCYPKARGFALSIHTVGASFGDVIAPPVAGLLMTALTWSETALVSSTPLFLMTILVFWKLKEIDRPAGEAQGASLSTRYIDGARLLLRDAQFLRLCIMAGLWSMSQNGTMFFIPLYLVGYMDASAAEVGLVMAAIQLGAMITGPFAGAWSDRVGRRPVVLLLLIVGAVTIAILPFVGTIVAFTVVASFFGCAIYSIRPVMHSWTMDLAGAQTSGSAVSMVFAFQSAMTVSIPILGGIAADIWGITVVFYIMTITCVGAAILVFSMPNIHAKKDV